MNTEINYLYRDGGNYKIYQSAIVAGTLTDEEKVDIKEGCFDDVYFYPYQVGLPCETFEDMTDDDPDWCEFVSIEDTEKEPTLQMTASELHKRCAEFIECRRWYG